MYCCSQFVCKIKARKHGNGNPINRRKVNKMITRLWKTTKKINRDARIEEHTFRNGEKHYSFRDRLERQMDIEESEIEKICRDWGMVEIELD